MKPDDMAKAIKERPSDALAFGRTDMANDRTLLSFLSTSLGLMGSGIGIVGYVERPFIVALGWVAISISVPLLIWGIWRYRKMKKLLRDVGAEILLTDKKTDEKL